MQEQLREHLKEKINYNSKKRLEMLKGRSKRCICKYCGGDLVVRQLSFSSLEDARIEIFCKSCDRIEFGVEPEIYQNAKFYVEETGFNCFPDLDDSARTQQMTVAKVCEIMTWLSQNIGILEQEGFKVPLKMNEHYIGECITLTDSDLQQEKELLMQINQEELEGVEQEIKLLEVVQGEED